MLFGFCHSEVDKPSRFANFNQDYTYKDNSLMFLNHNFSLSEKNVSTSSLKYSMYDFNNKFDSKRFMNYLKIKRTSILDLTEQYLNYFGVIKYVNSGANHYALLKDNGELTLHGQNVSRQCDTSSMSIKYVNSVSCGYSHTAILGDDGTVNMLGSNENQQCNLLGLPVGLKVKQVACGRLHTAMLLENDDLYLTGSNAFGQCDKTQLLMGKGHKKIKNVYCGQYNTALIYDNGSITINGDFNFKNTLLYGKKAKQLACGSEQTVVLFENGTLAVVGDNDLMKKSLLKRNISNAVQIFSGYFNIGIIQSDGNLIMIGDNIENCCQLENDQNKRIVSVSTGMKHSVYLFEDGTYKVYFSKISACETQIIDCKLRSLFEDES
eukprot:Mrub_04482.p1 GENE.Mrub_04482~~Mrub_04482.p1  ORF type:complete len:379 (-),score=72.51 Mrub_04482:127-1263(-)